MLITVRKGQARPVFSCNKDFSNVTTALGERFAAEQWQTMTKPESEVDTVLLTTDGMADEIDEARQEDFAIDLLAEVKMMDAHSRRIWLRNMLRKWTATPPSDDTTLVCLHRKKEEWTHVS